MLELLAAIEQVDPVALPLWGLFLYALALYPLGLMLGAECSVCCCPVCNPQSGHDCCGDDYDRPLGGVCCDNVWRPAGTEGVCCDDEWHTDEGVCCPELVQFPLTITGCFGSGAVAVATLNDGVLGVELKNGGSGYAKIGRKAPELALAVSGQPIGATGLTMTPSYTATNDACGVPTFRISSVAVSGGTGYVAGHISPIPPAGDVPILGQYTTLTLNVSGGVPSSVTINNSGLTSLREWYREDPTLPAHVAAVTVTGGAGATFSAVVDDDPDSATFGQIASIAVDSAGTEYLDWEWLPRDVWHSGGDPNQCCDDLWRTEEGDCCRDVWYPAADPCPDGFVYVNLFDDDQCCGCVPEQIWDGRAQAMVDTLDVEDDLVCCCLGIFLPFHEETGASVPCPQRCCKDNICELRQPAACEADGGEVLAGCCDLGCPAPCCREDAAGTVSCAIEDSGFCADSGGTVGQFVGEPTCEDACLGACCVDDVVIGQLTQQACESAGGEWGGLGSTECPGDCRAPYDENCCISTTSIGQGLTFTQPFRRRIPPFTTAIKVRATGTTDSPILIHGVPFGQDATPTKRCPFDVEFVICWNEFHVEPVPCGTNFKLVDITVCWDESSEDETLEWSGCALFSPIRLASCDRGCKTHLIYRGPGLTSGVTIQQGGDATIESSGTGPLVLTQRVAQVRPGGNCNRTLTLTGTNDGVNMIDEGLTNPPDVPSYVLGLIKRGPGRWRLAHSNLIGGFSYLYQGTLEIGVTTGPSSGALGTALQRLPVGEVGATGGVARLLLGNGINFTRWVDIIGSGRAVEIGTYDATACGFTDSTSFWYQGGAATVFAATGGQLEIFNRWTNGTGTGTPTANVTFGKSDALGEVLLTNNLRTSGTVTVAYGLLRVDGSLGEFENAASVNVSGGAELRYVSDPAFTRPLNLSGTLSGDVEVEGLVTIGVAATVSVQAGDVITFSGGMAGSGSLTKDGAGTMTIGPSNSWTGELTIDAGDVVVAELVDNPGGLGASATFTATTLAVAFSGDPATGAEYKLLAGSVDNQYASVTLTGTTATGTFDSASATLTID